ncbi:MAG: ECF transporter S component [Eubacteriales bacterium]|nr:ECF transporter S component [Eubacteriales bacterium]
MDVTFMAQIALLTGIMIVMAFTPLGYIPLPFMNATTMHIPVIVGACMLGLKGGAILGAVFGITSVVKATIQPNLTSFVFTPFYSFSPEFHGGFASLIVAIVPRILIGVTAALVFQILIKKFKKENVALMAAGFSGALVNTIGVMTLIGVFFGEQYASAGGTDPSLLYKVILGVIGLNGVPEAAIAGILTLTVGRALRTVAKRMPNAVMYR